MSQTKKNVTVSLGGASSSGKTTIAKILHSLLSSKCISNNLPTLLHQDDFFKPDPQIPVDDKSGYANWDIPDAIDMKSFEDEIRYLKNNGTRSDTVRYDSDTKDQKLEINDPILLDQIREGLQNIVEKNRLRLIFVDGFMLYNDPEIINELYDIKIFLVSSQETLLRRRERRKGYVTQETFWEDPPFYFEKIVWPSYVSTHGYLFNDHDPASDIDDKTCKELGLNWRRNDDGVDTVEDVLRWAYEVILREISATF